MAEDEPVGIGMVDDSDLHVEGGGPLFPDGPFKVKIQFGITTEVDVNGDYTSGYADCEMPVGVVPNDETIGKMATAVLGQLPEGFRFMTREEFGDHIMREMTRTNMKFAVDGPSEFRLEVFGRED